MAQMVKNQPEMWEMHETWEILWTEEPHTQIGFPGGSVGKESTCSAEDLGSMPGLGRPPGEGNGNQLQCSCLVNPMDRGAWWATAHRVAESQT